MDLKALDDETLDLAHKAAEEKYDKEHTLDNFKLVALYRYETNLRRYHKSENKMPLS